MTIKTLTEKKAKLLRKVEASKLESPKYVKEGQDAINLAVTGRVESWLRNSESRYPQSCTPITVEDSMEGKNGIEFSWLYASKALRYGAGVAIDLSKLRAEGIDNGRGLKSSGVCSFMQIYSKQNEILRRGGWYKNGAIVCFYDASGLDVYKNPKETGTYGFINYPEDKIPWIKRALYISDNPESEDYILNNQNLDKILDAARDGRIWLVKKRWEHPETRQLVNYPPNPEDVYQNRVLSPVCLELLLQSTGSCLLSHVNLGKCNLSNLVNSFRETAKFLCSLHTITGAGRDNYYLPPKVDRQVGLGVVGLANLLANMNITYKDFAECLYDWFTDTATFSSVPHTKQLNELVASARLAKKSYGSKVIGLVKKLKKAFDVAAEVGRRNKMVRMFTLAPTATCSYNHVDVNGCVTSPEISPPICHNETKVSIRDSDTFGQMQYQYPANVETASMVGWATYYKLCKAWQMLMDSTGLGHTLSFNVWTDCDYDLDWFKDWLGSPLINTYYRMMIDQSFNDKSNIEAGLDVDLIGDTEGFFSSFSDNLDEEVSSVFNNQSVFSKLFEVESCSLALKEDGTFCAACAE